MGPVKPRYGSYDRQSTGARAHLERHELGARVGDCTLDRFLGTTDSVRGPICEGASSSYNSLWWQGVYVLASCGDGRAVQTTIQDLKVL
jgi:hypothetical protein